MQFSVYEIMTKLGRIQNIMDKVKEDASFDTYDKTDVYELLEEYSDILKSAKVKI